MAMAAFGCMSGAVRRIGPLTDAARVYVDKLSFRVVTDAPGAKRKRSVAQFRRWNARNPDIERSGLDVL